MLCSCIHEGLTYLLGRLFLDALVLVDFVGEMFVLVHFFLVGHYRGMRTLFIFLCGSFIK